MTAKEEMEGTSNKRPLELPLSLNKPPISSGPFTMISPSCSINVPKNYYLLKHGEAGSSGTKRYRKPFSGEKASPVEVKQNKKIESPYPSIEINPSDDHAVASATKGRASLTLEQAIEYELKCGRQVDPSMDPKKLRRTISNRLSAQRSRTRKVQYKNDMEKKVKELQDTISLLSPKIASYRRTQMMLRMEKTMLEQQLESCMEKSKLCSKQIEENKVEVRRLRELHKIMKTHALNSEKEMLASSTIYQSDRPPSFGLHQSDYQLPPSFNFYQTDQEPMTRKNLQHGEIEQYLNLDAFNNLDPPKNQT